MECNVCKKLKTPGAKPAGTDTFACATTPKSFPSGSLTPVSNPTLLQSFGRLPAVPTFKDVFDTVGSKILKVVVRVPMPLTDKLTGLVSGFTMSFVAVQKKITSIWETPLCVDETPLLGKTARPLSVRSGVVIVGVMFGL